MKISTRITRLFLLFLPILAMIFVGCESYNNASFSHQGRLLDNNGDAVADGTYPIEYRLYHQIVDGTAVYTQTKTIAVKDGYFTSSFGSFTANPKIFTEVTYLEMAINGETMTPRQRLYGAPYAANVVAGAAIVGSQPITYTYGVYDNLGAALTVVNLDGTETGGSGLTAIVSAQPSPPGTVDVAAVRGLARDADSSDSSGVYGGIFVSEDYRGLYADGGSTYFAAYFQGNIAVTGSCTGCSMALVAQNDGAAPIQQGDFVVATGVVVDPDYDMPVMLVRKAVAGDDIIGVAESALTRGEYRKEALTQTGYDFVGGLAQPGEYVSIAMEGLVQVRVAPDATLRTGDYAALGEDGLNTAVRSSASVAQVMSDGDGSGLQWILLNR